MAQAPTLYNIDLALNHVDRAIEQTLQVRTARHPSETLERLWLRVLAYSVYWEERLAFGPGLSDTEAPDLQATNLVGETTLWLKVGKADPVKLQRVIDQNPRAQVAAVFESPARLEAFIAEAKAEKLTRLVKAELCAVAPELIATLARVDNRRTKLSLTFVGDHFYCEQGGVAFDGALTRLTAS